MLREMSVIVSEKEAQELVSKDKSLQGSYKSHKVRSMSDKPIGYLADHFVLQVSTSHETRDYFLKAVPTNVQKRVDYLDETGFFLKEVKVYEKLIPLLLPHSSLPWAPACYLFKDDRFIVMEILNDFKNFSTIDLVFDFDHMKVAAETLAVFHASSVIYEIKSGRMIGDDFEKTLEENAYPSNEGHIRHKGFFNALEVLSELIKIIPKYQKSENLPEILEKFAVVLKKIFKFVQPSEKFRNVFSHGDFWANNFMFSYEGKKPATCKFIDFQLARYSPPAVDLAQLVFINSTKEFRKENQSEILNIYCLAFECELNRAQIDLSALPRTEIIKSFNEYRIVGLIEAAIFGHLTLLPPTLSTSIMNSSEEYDKFINQSRVETCLKAFKQDYYRNRLTEILCEIVDDFVLVE